MVMFNTSNISCGVHQLYGFGGKVRDMITAARGHIGCRFLIFSDKVNKTKGYESGGQKLAKEIEDNRLGDLTKSTEGVNPNSSNNIAVWVWNPDHVAIDNYLKKPQEGAK